jgi:hypothetical protein
MLIIKLENKKKELMIGKSILLILDLEKFKKILFIIKSNKSYHLRDKAKNSHKLNLFQLMLMILMQKKMINLENLLI